MAERSTYGSVTDSWVGLLFPMERMILEEKTGDTFGEV